MPQPPGQARLGQPQQEGDGAGAESHCVGYQIREVQAHAPLALSGPIIDVFLVLPLGLV